MARYIDADKLTYSRVRIIHSDGTIGGWHAVVMSSVIKDAPAADVVEVVRCKYCKYVSDLGMSGLYCDHPDNRNPCGCRPNDFCNEGKRKEQT